MCVERWSDLRAGITKMEGGPKDSFDSQTPQPHAPTAMRGMQSHDCCSAGAELGSVFCIAPPPPPPLSPQVQPPHPLYRGQVPLIEQNLSYLQALVSQTPPPSPQSSGSRMMALDIDSVSGKRLRNGNDDNF